jgi:hypothetical protein
MNFQIGQRYYSTRHNKIYIYQGEADGYQYFQNTESSEHLKYMKYFDTTHHLISVDSPEYKRILVQRN